MKRFMLLVVCLVNTLVPLYPLAVGLTGWDENSGYSFKKAADGTNLENQMQALDWGMHDLKARLKTAAAYSKWMNL